MKDNPHKTDKDISEEYLVEGAEGTILVSLSHQAGENNRKRMETIVNRLKEVASDENLEIACLESNQSDSESSTSPNVPAFTRREIWERGDRMIALAAGGGVLGGAITTLTLR